MTTRRLDDENPAERLGFIPTQDPVPQPCSAPSTGFAVQHGNDPAPPTETPARVRPGVNAPALGLARSAAGRISSGADKHCQTLAAAAGVGGKTWRAYLSASAVGSSAAVNARDRIGKGPWKNAKGVIIANDVAELHGTNNLTRQTALTEKGGIVNGGGDTPNQHDILTGTQPDGTAFAGAEDKTCGNWTKSGDGSAIVGHHDRRGLDTSPPALSWNSLHPTRGCGDDALKSTGVAGYIDCFAAN